MLYFEKNRRSANYSQKERFYLAASLGRSHEVRLASPSAGHNALMTAALAGASCPSEFRMPMRGLLRFDQFLLILRDEYDSLSPGMQSLVRNHGS